MRAVELFAGAGGSALGISRADFRHELLIEWDSNACQTMRLNKASGTGYVDEWTVHEGDVRRFDYGALQPDIDLLAGGPPCQPFSLGGKHRAHRDRRDMFPEMARAVRELRPKAILVENVRGLVRPSFESYFEYILLRLTYPDIVQGGDEDWREHLVRLERHHTASSTSDLSYQVVFGVLNAADFGIPQKRERVFIVGFRSDLGVEWSFPSPTHSADELLHSQWVSGEYWERHAVPRRERPTPPARELRRIDRLRGRLPGTAVERPWRTVRDCLSDLPDPREPGAFHIPNHEFVDGARKYAGHTGSPWDEPAKTLKAGDHGVPGGENMLEQGNGRVRYFTVRECARLQTFPDEFRFYGSRTEIMRQLGNAVPVLLAQTMADSIRRALMVALHRGRSVQETNALGTAAI